MGEDGKGTQDQKSQQVQEVQQGGKEAEDQGKEVTIESLMSELAEARAESAKNKTALDKALKNNGELTKQLRARMTAQEQEDEARRQQKEEHEKYVKGLEDRIALTEAKERYLGIGMAPDLAEATAKAELEGDRDAVTSNYQKHMDSVVKIKENEWLNSRPEPNADNSEEDGKEDPFLKGFNSVQGNFYVKK